MIAFLFPGLQAILFTSSHLFPEEKSMSETESNVASIDTDTNDGSFGPTYGRKF